MQGNVGDNNQEQSIMKKKNEQLIKVVIEANIKERMNEKKVSRKQYNVNNVETVN